MRKINLIPLFIACILSACLSPSEGDGSPDELPTVTPISSPTTVFTATPSQTPTPEPTPTPDPAQIAAQDLADFKLNPADFTQKIGENGEIQYWDGSTLIYSGGAWNADKIVNILADAAQTDPNFCKQTGFAVDPSRASNWVSTEQEASFINYGFSLLRYLVGRSDFKAVNPSPFMEEDGRINYSLWPKPIANTDQCWFFSIRPTNPKGPNNFGMFETINGVVGFPIF